MSHTRFGSCWEKAPLLPGRRCFAGVRLTVKAATGGRKYLLPLPPCSLPLLPEPHRVQLAKQKKGSTDSRPRHHTAECRIGLELRDGLLIIGLIHLFGYRTPKCTLLWFSFLYDNRTMLFPSHKMQWSFIQKKKKILIFSPKWRDTKLQSSYPSPGSVNS